MTLPPFRICIDGEHGKDSAVNRGLDTISQVLEQQLVLLTTPTHGQTNRDGHDGRHARRACPGAPAGHITLRLSESREVYGGIHVDVIPTEPEGEVWPPMEVPVGRDILISAVGGNGEAGLEGGDGQDGLRGENGSDATEVVDATGGTNGGRGGAAGSGSSGGDGGQGGTIDIVVDDAESNLLMAINWDVRGGAGGQAGQHGQPGKGGEKGRGGKGHEWEVQIGYKFSCTNGCIGESGSIEPKSDALVRYGSVMSKQKTEMIARLTTQIITGDNMVAILAGVAARIQASRQPRSDPGACRCHGGPGNCTGCTATPIRQKLRRTPGIDGEDGMPGQRITTSLIQGHLGGSGTVVIVVNKADGTQQRYSTIYRLELVDFVVQDENGDSIIEPGEHVFICQIKVKNTGGMPSPARRIPVTFASSDSDWFVPVEDVEGRAYLPGSIPPGSSAIADGRIKVLIRECREIEMAPVGTMFFKQSEFTIKATMPWLDRELPLFEKSRKIDIQYPCQLQNFNQLATVAQGSRNIIKFEVFNKGNTAVGPGSGLPRPIEVDISFPPDSGVLQSDTGEWSDTVSRAIPDVPGRRSVPIQQQFRINEDAQCYQHIRVVVTLFLGKPSQAADEGYTEIVTIHQMQISMQISEHYVFQQTSSFLLVTNALTDRMRTQAIRKYIQEGLNMEVDTWNVALYGCLQHRDSETDEAFSIITKYPGRSIIFLCNRFDFFGRGLRTLSDFCDPMALAKVLVTGTNCVFLETADFQEHERLISSGIFSPRHKVAEVDRTLVSSERFDDVKQLVAAVRDGKQQGAASCDEYAFPVGKGRFGMASPRSEMKRMSRYLQENLPSERCIVTFSEPELAHTSPVSSDTQKSEASPQIIVSMGLPYSGTVAVVEPCKPKNCLLSGRDSVVIDPLEKFMITNSIPLDRRIVLLWEPQLTISEFALDCLELGFTLVVNREITALINSNALVPAKASAAPAAEIRACLSVNLPSLSALLNRPNVVNLHTKPNGSIRSILKMALASARPWKKRHHFSKQRSSTEELLHVSITNFLNTNDCTPHDITQFFQDTKGINSEFDATHKNVASLITKKFAGLVKRSEHAVNKGTRNANEVAGQTTWMDPSEWDERVEWAKRKTQAIRSDEEAAREILGRMVVERAPNI
ncbi:hypothetical protein V8E54_002943 [Elaphomyces granulatus]